MECQLDAGEASAIALALELADATIILYGYKARKIASEPGIDVTGTLGVIVKTKLADILLSVKPVLENQKVTNFRLTEELEELVLAKAGESA